MFWDWKTGRIKSRLKAHSKVVIAHEWLPHETVRGNFALIGAFAIANALDTEQGGYGVLGRVDQAMGKQDALSACASGTYARPYFSGLNPRCTSCIMLYHLQILVFPACRERFETRV